MRKWTVGLSIMGLALGLGGAAWAGPVAGGSEHRIVISSQAALQSGIPVRHTLSNGRVSATVTDGQLTRLSQSGAWVEVVPERVVEAPPGGKAGRGAAGKGRVLPPTQVPYGIKMVYGDPHLDPAQISGGRGISIAVLDTGSTDHPDFTRPDGSRVITGCVDFSNRRVDLVEGSCRDGHGHGTHVTGTIAAAGGADGRGIFGMAPGASILSYKVLADNGRGYADDVAQAIRVAADRGANIISMSLGASQPSPDEVDAIGYAVGKGVLVVASSGNNGPDADTIGYPGALAAVVAVASLNADEVVSYYSSRGLTDGNDRSIAEREVELSAPGRAVLSTYKDGGYYTMSGTSMAAPHIAGLAAKAWRGSADRTRIWLVQRAEAHDITGAEQVANAGTGYDIASGYGLPQVTSRSQQRWTD